MLHKTLETKATTVTEKGQFTAIAAAYSVDRVSDRIIPGAFAKTIEAWQSSGKQIPLHWDHKGDPEYIIGTVDPATMRETDAGLLVSGRLDLKGSGVARDAWRLIKSDSMALSFGYLPTKQQKSGDVNELHEIDLFEITLTPAPVNPDTKFLSFKSAAAVLEEEVSDEPSAVEDGGDEEPSRAKSAPQDALVKEAWGLFLPAPRKRLAPEPEPSEPEPLDPVAVQNEAWAMVLKSSGH